MRVTTAMRFDASVADIQQRQRDLAVAQRSMTDGKRIHTAGDDPTGAVVAERAHLGGSRIGAQQRAVEASRRAMSLAEATLGQAIGVLQEARETVVAAGNGSYTAGERAALVLKLRDARAQLLSLANQDDGAGTHLFGGQSAAERPFVDAPGGVQTAGDPGAMLASSSERLPLTLDARSTWLTVASGNGVFVTGAAAANAGSGWIDAGSVADPAALTGDDYEVVFGAGTPPTFDVLRNGAPTALAGVALRPGAAIVVDGLSFSIAGQPAAGDRFTVAPSRRDDSPFAALDRAIAALGDPLTSQAAVTQAVSGGLRDLDGSLAHLQAARSDTGATLARLEAVDNRDQDRLLQARTARAAAEDADMVQTISDFQNQQTGYQAALQSYAMVQRMSLLDYLR